MRARTPWWGPVWAEFAKIWDFGLPAYGYAGLLVYSGLIAFQAFHTEGLARYEAGLNAVSVMGLVVYSGWGKLIIVPLYLLIFGVYCVAVESQYGMIRIACAQPISRTHYAIAKLLAIALHAAAFSSVFSACLLAWSFVYMGFRGGTAQQWVQFVLGSALLMLNCIGWACIAASASLLRRTLLGAFVVATGVFIALIWLTIGRPWWFNDYNFLRYYMYPLGPLMTLKMQVHFDFPNMNHPLWQYCFVCVATPVALMIPALAYLRRRDITE